MNAETRRCRDLSLCNSVNLRVTLCNDFFTQSYTEKTQRATEKKSVQSEKIYGRKNNILQRSALKMSSGCVCYTGARVLRCKI
jgi:hypothetical protein